MMGHAFPGVISHTAAVAAPALTVMAIILFMGKISGAHLNPAVSIAFALRRDFPWKRVPGYIVVQLGGATLAALILYAIINVSATYGSNYPAKGYSAGAAFWMEVDLDHGPPPYGSCGRVPVRGRGGEKNQDDRVGLPPGSRYSGDAIAAAEAVQRGPPATSLSCPARTAGSRWCDPAAVTRAAAGRAAHGQARHIWIDV